MAAKFIVALACFALCHANPVILNGYTFRDGRGYSVGQGYTNNAGGQATGSATINGGVLQAYGSASTDDQNQLGRSGAYDVPFPGQAVAKAEVYDTPEAYYTVPAPGTIVTYQQNVETPAEVIYQYAGDVAQPSAILSDNSGSSITYARADGTGSAESSAESFGSGFKTVSSNVNNGYGAANSAVNELKGTQWRFGTAYNSPFPGQAQVSSQANGGSAKSTAHTDGVVTTADAQGYGSANANAHLPGGYINSAANTNGLGYGAARYTAGNEFGTAHSVINNGLGNIKTYANSNGYGNANSHADINEQGSLSSVSNSNGRGTAASSVNSVPSLAAVRSDGVSYIYSPQPTVNTQTSGQGSASARTQGVNTGYRVINSVANSFGYGSAQANASA